MNICYALAFGFPDSSAATRRVAAVVSLLLRCNFKVTLVSAGVPREIPDSIGIPADVRVLFAGERDSVGNVGGLIDKIKFGSKICSLIKQLDEKVDVVIAYGGYTPLVFRLLKLKRAMGISLVYDAVEWASLRPYWWRSAYLMNVHFAMSFLLKRLDGVICVSAFLYEHYKCRTKALRLPPLYVNTAGSSPSKRVGSACRLSYVGNSEHDNVDILVSTFRSISAGREDVELHIAGAFSQRDSIEQTMSEYGVAAGVTFYGTISQEQATEMICHSDALILLRDDNAVTQAGYSSKVVHALSLGVPLITNYKSDIPLTAFDGPAGVFFMDSSQESLAAGIETFINLSDDERASMKRSAIQVAEGAFEVSRFVEGTRLFFRGL